MSHLQTSTLETALDVKALINLGAVENALQKKEKVSTSSAHKVQALHHRTMLMRGDGGKTNLITPNLSSNKIQSLNNAQPQFLSLLILLDGNILNMTHKTKRMNELALNDQTSRSDDPIVPVTNDKHVIFVVAGGDPVESGIPCFLADFADGCQDAQDV